MDALLVIKHQARAYEAAGKIGFEGMHYRRDIGGRAAGKS
jgi:phosphoribosylamine-glycine ligase